MPGPKGYHSFEVVVLDAGGDDDQGRVGVTHLITTVHLADGPTLVGETLGGTGTGTLLNVLKNSSYKLVLHETFQRLQESMHINLKGLWECG